MRSVAYLRLPNGETRGRFSAEGQGHILEINFSGEHPAVEFVAPAFARERIDDPAGTAERRAVLARQRNQFEENADDLPAGEASGRKFHAKTINGCRRRTHREGSVCQWGTGTASRHEGSRIRRLGQNVGRKNAGGLGPPATTLCSWLQIPSRRNHCIRYSTIDKGDCAILRFAASVAAPIRRQRSDAGVAPNAARYRRPHQAPAP